MHASVTPGYANKAVYDYIFLLKVPWTLYIMSNLSMDIEVDVDIREMFVVL